MKCEERKQQTVPATASTSTMNFFFLWHTVVLVPLENGTRSCRLETTDVFPSTSKRTKAQYLCSSSDILAK